MNSAENVTKHSNHNNNYYSPVPGNDVTNHEYSTKSPKKDKKWSFGSIFRRKKKNESDSSSDDENKKKKRPSRRLTRSNNPIGFDHVLIPNNAVNGYSKKNVLSESDHNDTHGFISGSDIIRPGRKCKREGVKARAEARIRDNSRGENSSDEDSPFRSDESLTSYNRRSRSARTQRYLRRHSKDGEFHITRSDELWKPGANFSGISTIPPGHRTLGSNKSSSYCNYNVKNNLSELNNQRSVSYDGNIHCRARTPSTESVIIHAQLPLGFTSNMPLTRQLKAPPPPPPRDPTRMINIQNGETRPISYAFDHKTNSEQLLHRLNPRVTTNRSTSEDQLSVPPEEIFLVPRPSSTTPKCSDYRYLTDKNPRSRKPICIMQPNSFDFWKQREDRVPAKSPLMFTAKTHVTTNIFAQPENKNMCSRNLEYPVTVPVGSTVYNNTPEDLSTNYPTPKVTEDKPRKSTNLEEALDELEAIYKSLHLGDEELLDRAAERESILEQNSKPKIKSEPDPKSDDMAYRKFRNIRTNTVIDSVTPGSYLLTSPVFGGNVGETHTDASNNEPDITFDDVVYRNVKHTNNTLKVVEPQPPFGIPVGPILPSTNSDYLHIAPYNFQKSKKVPDVVKDDLAYRNLRKDPNKEPALPQAHLSREDYLNNNNYKKKRAVRSLSANIYNLMYQHEKPNPFEDVEPKQNIDDVADALEIARQILKDKEDKIIATRKAFLSDGELKYKKVGHAKFKRDNKHVDRTEKVKVEAKLPKASKTSMPLLSVSPNEDAELEKALQHSTLEELLTSLARETTEHITHELNAFDDLPINLKTDPDEQRQCISQPEEVTTICCESLVLETVPNVTVMKEDTEEEHDYVNFQSHDEDEYVTDETLNKVAVDTYRAEKQFIHGIDDTSKNGGEECVNVNYIALPTNGCTYYVNKSSFEFDCFNYNSHKDTRDANDDVFNEIRTTFAQLIESSKEIQVNAHEHAIVTSHASHSTIDDGNAHYLDGENVCQLENGSSCMSEQADSLPIIETINDPLKLEHTNLLQTFELGTNEPDTVTDTKPNVVEFKLGPVENREISHIDVDFDSLKSPRLVQILNASCSNQNAAESKEQTVSDVSSTNCSWYDDPSIIALACSCGIACSYQLSFDIIAILGIVFAVISMLLAVITRI